MCISRTGFVYTAAAAVAACVGVVCREFVRGCLCCCAAHVCLCRQEEERERRADFVPEQSAIQTDNIEVWRFWLWMECRASRQRFAAALPAAVSTHWRG